MVRKIQTIDDAPVDVVEAVKRGFIHRGLIPRKYRRNDPTSDDFQLNESDNDKKEKSKNLDNKSGKEGMPQSDTSGSAKDGESTKTSDSKSNRKASGKIEAKNPEVALIDSQPGSQEAAKDPGEPEPGETHEKLIDITEKAHDVLFSADTVFPFTPFPHTLTLDREKLTIASRSFFRVATILTVPISSMISAEVNLGPFFASVKMTSKYFVDNTHSVNFLWRKDATEIHRLLQGFIIAHEKGIDVSEIDKDDLRVLLHDLGQGVSD